MNPIPKQRSKQQGVALFTAIFLVVVIALVATVVTLTTTTQQIGAARSLNQEQAYYAAMARVEMAVAAILEQGADCGGVTGSETLWGFTTEMPDCSAVCVNEGGDGFTVFTLRTRAVRGDLASGTLVRRSIRTQFVREEAAACP